MRFYYFKIYVFEKHFRFVTPDTNNGMIRKLRILSYKMKNLYPRDAFNFTVLKLFV